jgi:hypothetical protein
MNSEIIQSVAEQNALAALQLSTFSGFDLAHAKSKLADMLNHIGRNGMFSEYTKHDISHIDGMLRLLDDIIVEEARNAMTPTDWMMLVLSVYFHDIGMIITQGEFDDRMQDESFTDYLQNLNPKSYNTLKKENRDKAIYQDYVRKHHGDRACEWIESVNNVTRESTPVINLLYNILHPINSKFLNDLARVCKSHQSNLEDMFTDVDADIRYEQAKESKANLIFCAAVLRTADLMHVNSERTPEVDFLLISPQNAYSRREWVQQKAVTCILPREERNQEGVVDPSIEKHFFEVRAEFTDDDAYSHFNKYLDDAEAELMKTNRFCKESSRKNNDHYKYPWDGIDRSKILPNGFSAQKLRFELDKDNILKLLIGHTLYSNANVVLRELSQNAIDAGRLMNSHTKETDCYEPKVEITWDTSKQTLTVADNGVGMSEKIIREFLFKVGVSSYQSDEFKKEHPDFHSISRFGIGILTCFMVSDEINITTLNYKEKKAHLIKIRNIEGEYILRHDAGAEKILGNKHGTTFELKFRDNINVDDFEKNLRRWIVIPKCKVSLTMDGHTTEIGFSNIDEVFEKSLQKHGINVGEGLIHLAKYNKGGLALRVLIKKNEYSGNSEFYTHHDILNDEFAPIGCCIEGIRVTFDTPGYDKRQIIALVDCTGKDTPSTNVARDRLEEGDNGNNLSNLYRFIYESYIQEILKRDVSTRYKLSPYFSIRKSVYTIDELWESNNSASLVERKIFDEMLRKAKCVYVDNGNKCEVMSLSELPESIWTFESQTYSSAICLAAELSQNDQSPQGVIETLKHDSTMKRTILVDEMCRTHTSELFLSDYQADRIECDTDNRSILVHWHKGLKNWITVQLSEGSHYAKGERLFVQMQGTNVEFSPEGDENIFVTKAGFFLRNTTPIAKFLEDLSHNKNELQHLLLSVLASFVADCISKNGYDKKDFDSFFNKDNYYYNHDILEKADKDGFEHALKSTTFRKVDFNMFYVI